MLSLLSYHFIEFILIATSLYETMSFTVEPVGSHVSDLGEGPHWDEKSKSLYHVDAFVGDICRLNVSTGQTECFNLKDLVTIVIPYQTGDDLLLVSLRNKVLKLDWKAKSYEVLAEVAAQLNGKERFNDGKIDARGRLWIGTVLDGDAGVVKGGGSLYRLDKSGFTKMSGNFTLSNGMAWSHDGTRMFFNDSEDRKIYTFDYNLEMGTISNKRVFLNLDGNLYFESNEYPDGMTIDNSGKLWVSLYGGGRVVQIDVNTAQVENSVKIPAIYSTSVAFGGDNYDQLYVTTGNGGMSAAQKAALPNAGKVFRVTGDALRGRGAANRYVSTV